MQAKGGAFPLEQTLPYTPTLSPEEGAYIKDIPQVFTEFGLRRTYTYHRNLTLAELRIATTRGAAIVEIKTPKTVGPHSVVVDGFEEDMVLIRDPLPVGSGSAYKVAVPTFEKSFYRGKINVGGTGSAVVVDY